ncbi:acetylglutamate kinase [bacterium BMS3Abin07]|nr:acetylglutamate kinase [bacterium BMS3Abin07]GBE31544.1 acetylglutamate kinase [bacterium BMS3Bbin05]HDL19956.1 acetylglutamate kinase [Nitrospirota bacterium]
MKKLIEKANILIEALPYIKEFCGKTFVIKYGGAAQVEDKLKDAFAQDVVLLKYIGINPVIVHGGGPRISQTMKQMGKKPEFIEGQRVTDRETIDIVEMVLGGLVNKEIVTLINSNGGRAVGLSGKDGGLVKAKKKVIKKQSPETGVNEIIDIGLVGEVESIDSSVLATLGGSGFIPVIAPVGVDIQGTTFNINADFIAGAIASAVDAEKLLLLTDVEGISNKKGEILPTLRKSEVNKLKKNGTISGGMLPKVEACVNALKGGVKKIHIIDGRIEHCLLLEIFTEKGIGTEIVR